MFVLVLVQWWQCCQHPPETCPKDPDASKRIPERGANRFQGRSGTLWRPYRVSVISNIMQHHPKWSNTLQSRQLLTIPHKIRRQSTNKSIRTHLTLEEPLPKYVLWTDAKFLSEFTLVALEDLQQIQLCFSHEHLPCGAAGFKSNLAVHFWPQNYSQQPWKCRWVKTSSNIFQLFITYILQNKHPQLIRSFPCFCSTTDTDRQHPASWWAQPRFQKLAVQTATVEARQLRVQLRRCPVSKVAAWQHCNKKILSDRPTETYKYACLEGLVCVYRHLTQKVTNASQCALLNWTPRKQRFPSDLLVGEEHLLSYGISMVLKQSFDTVAQPTWIWKARKEDDSFGFCFVLLIDPQA